MFSGAMASIQIAGKTIKEVGAFTGRMFND